VTLTAFTRSLADSAPPPGLSAALLALWHDARGDWDAAHGAVQDVSSTDAAWVHAYLHRQEGDRANARYWYDRAGRPEYSGALDSEWTQVAAALLDSLSPNHDH